MLDLDFKDHQPKILFPPQFKTLALEAVAKLNSFDLNQRFIIYSSGTSSQIKGYVIHRDALFANAKAVNTHFNLGPQDIWGLSLPEYHIGGLSVLARAHLLQNKIIDCRGWRPDEWIKKITDEKISITTIVPTQLYDLVRDSKKAPPHLRYLVVGGDFLSLSLSQKAIDLGWPVIRTFGMSEVCSQLASAKTPHDLGLEVLPIHQVKTDDSGRLLIKSRALFDLQFIQGKTFEITKSGDLCDKDGFYPTQDQVKIEGNKLYSLGRLDEQFKTGGHLINLNILKEALHGQLIKEGLYGKAELKIEDDERKGKRLELWHLSELSVQQLDLIKSALSPVKLDLKAVNNFNRTDLGKLKK